MGGSVTDERERRPVYVRSTHPNSYRSGQWAKIIGVEWIPRGMGDGALEARPALTVEFVDGVDDMWALNDPVAGYEYSGQVTP